MYMILVYFIILFIISNGLGKLLLNESSKLYKLRAPIGFALLLSILQIGYYPIQYFSLSSSSHLILTAVIIIVSTVFGIIKLKKEDLFFLKCWEFYVLLTLIFIIIKVLPINEAGDDWFYMPLIMDNASINKINSIYPKTGTSWPLDTIYQFQGYYLFMSFLYKIQNYLFNNIDSIFVTFRATMSLLFLTFSSIIINFIKNIYKTKNNNKILTLIEIVSILLLGVLEWSHIYWGSFVIFPVFIPLYIIVFNEYLKNNQNKNYLWILLLINGAMLSLVSSALFLSAFLTFSFFIYSLYEKNASSKDYFFILLPLFIYTPFLINKIWLIPILFVIYFILKNEKVNNFLNNFINKYLFYAIIFLPIIFILAGIFLKLKFTWNIYRLSNVILLFNVVITIWILYVLYKKKKVEPLLFVFAVFIIFFFNPLTGSFISNTFKITEVYYRLFYVTKNPVIIFVILYFVYKFFEGKKILNILYIIGLSVIFLRYSYYLCSKTILEPTYLYPYNFVLREDIYSRELGMFLNEIASKNKRDKVLSIYFSPRQYNLNFATDIQRYPNHPMYSNDIVNKVLYTSFKISEEERLEFTNTILLKDYDYIIVYNKEDFSNRIKDYGLVFKNKIYQLYKIEKEDKK